MDLIPLKLKEGEKVQFKYDGVAAKHIMYFQSGKYSEHCEVNFDVSSVQEALDIFRFEHLGGPDEI